MPEGSPTPTLSAPGSTDGPESVLVTPDDRRSLISSIPPRLLPVLAVFATYLLAVVLLPTMAPVAISDDWTYARSVEILVREQRIHILPVAAATQIFQLFWGWLFALTFGLGFGALRLSTIAIILLSGVAFYHLLRELNVPPQRAALGVAVYLFNPVLFPITFTFMSDPHFLGLLVIASWLYLRGLRSGPVGVQAQWAGSVIASLACLQRPHGALIPLAVASWMLASGRLRVDRVGLITCLRVGGLPALVLGIYYGLISSGLPSQQGLFFSEIQSADWTESWLLVRRLASIELTYIGLFVLPLVVMLLGHVWAWLDLRERRLWLLFFVWETVLVAGTAWLWGEGRRMPYVPHFFGRGGPGSGDLRLAKAPLAGPIAFDWLTIVCVIASAVFALAVIRAFATRGPASAGAGLMLTIALWQMAGVVPQSFLFRNWIISLDRYLLPILPFAIALLLWALNGIAVRAGLAWGALALVALYSVLGTRDALVFQDHVWALASRLNAAGVDDIHLDAGYAWDAYHLWEISNEFAIPKQTPDGTWWTDVYATATDSTYVIAGGPIEGYDVLSVQSYPSILQRKPTELYVLRRAGAATDGVVWPSS